MKKNILHIKARFYLIRRKNIAYLCTVFIIMLTLLPSPVRCQPPILTRISPNLIPYNYPNELTLEGYYFDETCRIVLIGSAPKTIKQKPAIDPSKENANITAIHLQDKYLYILEDSTTLHILDIEKPDAPRLVGTLTDPNFKELKQVWATEKFLYLTDSGYGIWVVDVSDPNLPYLMGTGFSSPGILPIKVYVKEEIIYSIWEEDLPEDPNIPLSSYILIFKQLENGIIDLIEETITTISGHAYDISVKGYEAYDTGDKCELAYVATGKTVQIYEVTDLTSPTSKISQIKPEGSSDIQRLLIEGNILYIVDRFYGIHIANLTNLTDPQIVSSLSLQGEIKDICPCGPYALVANGLSGIQIIDLHERETPSVFGNIYTFGDATTICSYSYYIYVANGNAGLGIVEAPSFVHSNLLAYKNTKDNIWAITSQNGYAYVSNGGSGIKVFQTYPSWEPTPVSEILNDPNDAPNKDHLFTYAFVKGDMLYLADKREFEAWNIEDFSLPKKSGKSIQLQDPIMSIFVQEDGKYAYLANLLFGTQSIKIDPPDRMELAGYIFSGGLAYDIILDQNKLAYLANDQEGLWIVDFQNPSQPVEKSKLNHFDFSNNLKNFSHSLEKYNDHIYMTNGSHGIEIIDVSNPNTPYHIETINYTDFLKERNIEAPFNDSLEEIDIESPFLYTAGDYQGIWINYISYIPGYPPKVTPIDFVSLPYGASAVKSDGEQLYFGDDFGNFYIFYSPIHILVDPRKITENMITFRLTRQDLPTGSYDIFVISESGVGRLEKALNVYQNKVTFYPGLNILSYPGLVPFENAQAFSLLKNLSLQEEGSNLKIKNIWMKKMDSESESFQIAYINQEKQPAGDNFDILPVRGYLIYFQGTQKKEYFLPSNPLNLTKAELIKRLKSEITQGQNIISMPLIQDSIIKSSDLIFSESQPTASAIQEWDATQGKWHSGYNFFNTANGNVKNLTGGHGYLVSVP